MKIDEDMLVPLNYDDERLPLFVQTLRPVVFREGNNYCALLGPDPQGGIFGCATTLAATLEAWESDLRHRLGEAEESDEVIAHVKEILKTAGIETW